MYKNYKSNLSKPSKPNLPKGQQKSQGTVSQKVVKPKPGWNDSVKDEANYKLSASELVQKKINLMSKHRLEAKEEWLERQEKLRRGVLDEETKKIYDTAKQSKNLSTREDEIKRKNLSQMINFIEKPQKDSKVIVEQVKQNIEQTRKFIHKMEQYQHDEDPNRLLRVIDRLNKNQDQLNCNYDTMHQNNRGQGSLRKSARSMSSQNMNSQRQNSSNENKLSDKKYNQSSQMQSDFFSSSSKENQKDMANYFHSLDKIEETIKFMEDKILCERKSPSKQNNAASKIVEKKLFNEIQESSENTKSSIQDNKQKNAHNQQQDRDDSEFETHYHYNMIANQNQFDIKNFEVSKESQNTAKQLNTSRGSKNIDNDALSFNLTDCEDESQIHGFKNRFEQSLPKNYNRSRSQSQDKKIQSYSQGKKQYQQENDLVVNDFKCNIDMIDPNIFFNNKQQENEEPNNYEYQYGNKKTYQENNKNTNEDTLKSDFQRNYEDTLSSDNYHKKQQSNFVQQYDNIAQKKRQELSSQQATVKFQYDTQNDLYSKLKQQTEDDSDQFYANRIAPQPYTNNYFKETQKESEFVSKQPIQSYSIQQQAQEEEQGGDDYLSRNIDQLKEILEATKKDLEKLENNNLNSDEFNYFSSQYQQNQQEGTIQGKKIQKTIAISRNNELSELQAIQSIKRVANNLLESTDNKQIQQSKTLSNNQNPAFINQYKQQELQTNNVFIQDSNKIKQNNLFSDINEQQNFFTSNIFLCNNNSTQKLNGVAENMYKQTDPYFTSNIFLNDNMSNNNNNSDLKNNQQNFFSNNQIDTQIQTNTNIVKQDMFKKSIQNYSNQGVKPQDSLYIRHHLK
ncbi:hypothetical protein ABPG72_013081 [Tetrahymena utriculariae]